MTLFGPKTNKGGIVADMIMSPEQNRDWLIYKWRPEGEEAGSTRRENSIRFSSSLLDKAGSRNIKSYNKFAAGKGAETLPYLVMIIDEFAGLMAVSGKEMEGLIARLAAMSRAVGIHLVLATQRPSADVITGLIKGNIPARIAFMVAAMTDSRIIIDMPGAEKLLGRGDMLYCGPEKPFPIRAQGVFVSEEDAENTAAYLRTLGTPDYINEKFV